MHGIWAGFCTRLARPVSGASLGVFRIFFGLVMALEAYALCAPNPAAIASGGSPLENYYTGEQVTFHLPYAGLEWLPLLPPAGIYTVVGLLGLAGVMLALGLFYRVSAAAVFLTWTYLWVVESTRSYWQSHYYLETLLAFLMIWMPAARRFSIDAWRRRRLKLPTTVPFWTIFLLRGQLVIAYFYAGVAKLTADWLLDAVPVRWFLAKPEVIHPMEPYLTSGGLELVKSIVHSVEFAYFISYAGALFDLAVGPLLLIRRTRIIGLVLMIVFHATNHFLIFDDIGWFPLVGVTTALIFLEPDWPLRFAALVRQPRLPRPDWRWFTAGLLLLPPVGAALGWRADRTSHAKEGRVERLGRGVALFVALWLVWQALVPLRHFLIAGDGRFTYEGMSFSWRLKSEVRQCVPHLLVVGDTTIVSRAGDGSVHIDWDQWKGDQVIYRQIEPGRVNWSVLPEVVLMLEPFIGERIVYNPYCRYAVGARTEEEALQRAGRIWQDVYQRKPHLVRTRTLADVFGTLEAALHDAGLDRAAREIADVVPTAIQLTERRLDASAATVARQRILELLSRLHQAPEVAPVIRPLVRTMSPFAVKGEPVPPLPFLVIEDRQLILPTQEGFTTIDRQAWSLDGGGEDRRDPLVVYTCDVDADTWNMLPQAFIMDFQDHPERAPLIRWNSGRDLSLSKLMHSSMQAFYLQRYATRVAELWERQYDRRPTVHALTSLSLNGRPFQPLVEPSADLASVPVRWFGHNEWIRHLETPRIPREKLHSSRGFLGSPEAHGPE